MDGPLMLAIETSSRRGSVALGRDGTALAAHALTADRKNAAELLPAIDELLAQHGVGPRDISVICFSQGPGSFTGLRLAATIARLWNSVVGCDVVAAPSLEVIARNALDHPDHPARVAVALDARQGQIFGATFERRNDVLDEASPAALHAAEEWIASLGPGHVLLGDGVAPHRAAVDAAGLITLDEALWTPDARQTLAVGYRLARAGRYCKPEEIMPAYLRPPECEEVYEQRRAAARRKRGE